jgi:uncharacterized integral membrane protein
LHALREELNPMRLIVWLLRALVFFVLFAFAMNNQHEVEVHWFFGLVWRAPMVVVVLAALGLGCLLGALAMLPSWWRQRRRASRATRRLAAVEPAAPPPPKASAAALPVTPDGV